MENPEEILHSLEEFAKLKPKDIPRELEDYLCFVAKTGDPVYQWSVIKSLFREKLINVITEFYESCPSVEIPPCPNVDLFNYDTMKTFILEKLDTFVAAPFTVQRICELLTTPRKEYNRIDKYMRALEKNILVVSTTEPGNHRTPENGDGFVNGIETEHIQDPSNDINIEEMEDTPSWPQKSTPEPSSFQSTSKTDMAVDTFTPEASSEPESTTSTSSNTETVITCCPTEEQPYVSIERVTTDTTRDENTQTEADVSVTITAIPAAVQKRRDSIEPPSEANSELEVAAAEKKDTEIDVTVTESGDAGSDTTETKTPEPVEAEPQPDVVEDNLKQDPEEKVLTEDTISDKIEVEPNLPKDEETRVPIIEQNVESASSEPICDNTTTEKPPETELTEPIPIEQDCKSEDGNEIFAEEIPVEAKPAEVIEAPIVTDPVETKKECDEDSCKSTQTNSIPDIPVVVEETTPLVCTETPMDVDIDTQDDCTNTETAEKLPSILSDN